MDAARHRKSFKMVPFKWEQAPGLPIKDSCSSNELLHDSPIILQLPPKLQCQGNPSALPSIDKNQAFDESPFIKRLTRPINKSLFTSSSFNNKQPFETLCKFVVKRACCTRSSPPSFTHSWSLRPPRIKSSSLSLDHRPNKQHSMTDFHDRFFFDRHSPKDLRHAAMNPIIPIFDASDTEEDEVVNETALKVLVMDKVVDAERSSDSSPWHPLCLYWRDDLASPHWQPASSAKLQNISLQHIKDDSDDNDSFQDFFSSGTSMKPSKRTDDTMESASSSPTTPWYLNFSPEVEEMNAERRGSRLIVKLVALTRLRVLISRFKKKKKGINHHQFAERTMWSPTLATYLHNQRLEKEKEMMGKQRFSTANYSCMINDDEQSESGSDKLQINPNYYLPNKIRTHFMSPNQHTYSDGDDKKDDNEDDYKWKSDPEGSCLLQQEEVWNHNLHSPRHKLSMRSQLADFDNDKLSPIASHRESLHDPTTPAGLPGTHACKGVCKVHKW